MKRVFLSLFFVNCFVCACAQEGNLYNGADNLALNIPAAQTNTTADIAAYIGKHINTESKKIQAIYSWVTTHIRYDKDSVHRVILEEDREEKVTFALRRRKGVCENFAAIFNDICVKSGIRSFVVEGYTRQNGTIDRTPHAWCAANINNRWYCYDPTWDAGYLNGGVFTSSINTKFFQVLPEDFINTHIPFDPLFQFLNYPVTYNEFSSGHTGVNSRTAYFDYIDSIAAYEKMDSLSRYLSTLSRIEKNGVRNEKTDTKIKQVKLEVEIIYQDRDIENYNEAVAGYNNAIAIFNEFVNYRNNQFQPEKRNDEVQQMFNDISASVAAANTKLKEVNQSKATLSLDTGDVQKKLNDLSLRLKEQQEFFKNYISPKER